MSKIYSLKIDLSDMPTEETVRQFTVSGDKGAEFKIIALQNPSSSSAQTLYYNFVDRAFAAGHNNKNNNLKVTMRRNTHNGSIRFPSGGGTYTIKLISFPGTETQGSSKHVISKIITKQASNATVTFTAATANTDNYATFPTTTSIGGSTSVGNFNFNWDIVNASTDAGGFGLRLAGAYKEIADKHWYFTTTDTVNGATTASTTVIVDSTTDIVAGMVISAVTTSTLSGAPYVVSVDTETKVLTLSIAQTFADGITLTFKAVGAAGIKAATGLDLTFTQYPKVTPTVLTQVVRADSDGDFTHSTTVTLVSTHGVSGGDVIVYTGVGVDNRTLNRVTSVTPDCPDLTDSSSLDGDGLMVVETTQRLRAGTVLTFADIFKTINFLGNIVINSYPSDDRTIYLDLDQLITVGTAS